MADTRSANLRVMFMGRRDGPANEEPLGIAAWKFYAANRSLACISRPVAGTCEVAAASPNSGMLP